MKNKLCKQNATFILQKHKKCIYYSVIQFLILHFLPNNYHNRTRTPTKSRADCLGSLQRAACLSPSCTGFSLLVLCSLCLCFSSSRWCRTTACWPPWPTNWAGTSLPATHWRCRGRRAFIFQPATCWKEQRRYTASECWLSEQVVFACRGRWPSLELWSAGCRTTSASSARPRSSVRRPGNMFDEMSILFYIVCEHNFS